MTLLSALPSGSGTFGPIVDGEFLPAQPRALYDGGEIAKVPYILGSNTDEGTLFTLAMTNVTDEASYEAALKARFPNVSDQVLAQYPSTDFMSESNPYLAALSRAFGDSALVCSTWDTAVRAAKSGSPTWMYNFSIPTDIAGLGATHGSELVYVFGTNPSLTPEQMKVSDLIQSYWTNLAKTSDPNAAPLLNWPKFSMGTDNRINFALEPSIVQNFRSDKCQFWQSQYNLRF
jgi:para-nitrobenzyl esterase